MSVLTDFHASNRSAAFPFELGLTRRVAVPLGLELPVRVTEQRLQSFAKRRREAGGPRRIDEADAGRVVEVRPALVAPSEQFHPQERFEPCHLKRDAIL